MKPLEMWNSLVIRCWGQNPNLWFGYAFVILLCKFW